MFIATMAVAVFEKPWWLGASFAAFAMAALIIILSGPKRDMDARVEWTAGSSIDQIVFSNDSIDIEGKQRGKEWAILVLWPEVDGFIRLAEGIIISWAHGENEIYVAKRWCEPSDFDRLITLIQAKLGAKAEISLNTNM